jgi:hypothetical protein
MSSQLPGQPGAKTKPPKKHAVVFHTYPKLIFAWPLVVVGFLCYPAAVQAWLFSAETLAWIYITLTLLVVLTIGVDIERNYAVFWFFVFMALFFAGRWLEDYQGITVVGDLYAFFNGLDAQYDRAFGLSLSIVLAVPYAVMYAWTRIQHRWRITHNEFEHYSWGRADDSLARGAKRVRSTYPDVLEFLLCGAGTLIVYSATGRSELRRIPHVPLIFLVRHRINRLMEYTAVVDPARDTQEAAAAEELESAEVEGDDEDQGGLGEGDGGNQRDDEPL